MPQSAGPDQSADEASGDVKKEKQGTKKKKKKKKKKEEERRRKKMEKCQQL